jgi:hypothetical protein
LPFRRFSLQPFSEAGRQSELKIAGRISRISNRLAIHYRVAGQLAEVLIPAPADIPSRKNALWEDTCFEIFIAVKDSSRYWEFNLSPAGHWNVFHFSAYRKDMRADTAIGPLPFGVRRRPGALSLSLEMDMSRIIRLDRIVEVGLSAVIKYKSGERNYWALVHPGQEADFHRRESFIIQL